MSCLTMFAMFTSMLFTLCLQAPQQAPPAQVRTLEPARVSIDPMGMVDWGSMGPKETRTKVYRLTNTSDAPIRMRVLDLPGAIQVSGAALDQPIAPKAHLPLTVTVHGQEETGIHQLGIRMLSDDPKQGRYVLPIRYQVRPDLTVDAERQTLQDVAPHESPAALFTFTRETGVPTTVKVTGDLPPYLEVDSVSGDKRTELRLILRPARIPDGMRSGLETLQVETNAPKEPSFVLYLAWNVAYPIEAAPTRVTWVDATKSTAELTLTARDGKPFRIREARIEGEGFALSPSPKAPAPRITLSLTRTAKAKCRATLVVHFEGDVSSLRVPLAYMPPQP